MMQTNFAGYSKYLRALYDKETDYFCKATKEDGENWYVDEKDGRETENRA